MRLFGSEKTAAMIKKLGLPEDEPIEAGILTKAIENAQKKVEGNNFSARKIETRFTWVTLTTSTTS